MPALRRRMGDDSGSAIAAAVFVMPLVLAATLAVLAVVTNASRAQQLRTVTVIAAHEAAVQSSPSKMRNAALARVHKDFVTAAVSTRIVVIGGVAFVQVDALAPALRVTGLNGWLHLRARAHAVLESA